MIGCDIISIDRIRRSWEKYGEHLLRRILSEKETEIFYKRGNAGITFLAGRFAAKEAVSKAYGTGIGGHMEFTDIEILPDEAGAPLVYLKGGRVEELELSISHCKEFAIAVCSDSKQKLT